MKKHKALSPLLWALVGTTSGIWLQSMLNIALPTFIILGVIITLVGALAFKQKSLFLLLATATLAGAWWGALFFTQKTNNYQTALTSLGTNILILEATVEDIELWPTVYKGQAVKLNIEEIKSHTAYVAKHYDIMCFFRKCNKKFRIGDRILIQNIQCKADMKKDEPETTSYADYLVKEGVLASFFLLNDDALSLISRPDTSFSRWLWEWRQSVYENMQQTLDKKTFQYVSLIFLGNKKQPNIDRMRTVFNRWGLAHYLARAGLHIVIFIFLWTFLLRLIPIHLILKRLLLLLLCILYDLLSWGSIPFIRAFYAFLLANGGLLSFRSVNTMHILTIICLWVLLCNPMHLFFLDFQLTFALTFLLLFL